MKKNNIVYKVLVSFYCPDTSIDSGEYDGVEYTDCKEAERVANEALLDPGVIGAWVERR